MNTSKITSPGDPRTRRRFSREINMLFPTNYTHSRRPSDLYWDMNVQDIVCVPSLSFCITEMKKIAGAIHYEERQLFNLLHLRKPKTRLIFLTSIPIDQTVVQYYLSLVPDISPLEVGHRLIFLSTYDSSPTPLTQKILARPRLIARIKNMINPHQSCMLCFSTTESEKKLASLLGIPLLGNDPEFDHWGSKSGSRSIFLERSIPHPAGVAKTHSAEELAQSICEMLKSNPNVEKMMVKLDSGFGGQGNAFLDLSFSPSQKASLSKEDIMEKLSKMKFASPQERWETFKQQIGNLGVIAEEFIPGEMSSPSVQGYISPNGKVEILSTHDQVLSGQIYHGCTFPASEHYRATLHHYGESVGEALASKGARGFFGVDFLASKNHANGNEINNGNNNNNHEDHNNDNHGNHNDNNLNNHNDDNGVDKQQGIDPTIYAIEINLRQGGTTHPYFTMKLLTDGSYDKNTGMFYSNKGCPKYYQATDNLKKDVYKGLLPVDVLEIADQHGLKFSPYSQSGVVFHMLGAMSEYGKVGYTAIGDTVEEVEALYAKVERALDEETSIPLHKLSLARSPSPLKEMLEHPPSAHLSPKNTTLTFGHGKLSVLLTVCIHGDEVCGFHGVNELIDEGYFDNIEQDKIKLVIMLGNPLAYSKGVRFINRNLNRVILPHLFESGGYETFRARGIANAIFDCDVYLDLHSTSAPSPPLCLPAANAPSEEMAKGFPVDYVVEELAHATEIRGTTMDWAYFHKKKAVSIECGQHNARESVEVAKRAIKHLVESCSSPPPSMGMLSACTPLYPPPKIMRCVGREKVRAGFRYKKQVKSFQLIHDDEIVAEDETGPLKSPSYHIHLDGTEETDVDGAFVAMPTSLPYQGEEAFYWLIPSETQSAP